MNEQFPLEELAAQGYEHVELNGQKAYHGVATLARMPLRTVERTVFGGIDEARHISMLNCRGSSAMVNPVQIHNFYVPAGGDAPDIKTNPKFAHKLDFLTDMATVFGKQKDRNDPMILVGDLNIALA